MESVYFLVCDSIYNLRRQRELENTGHNAFRPNDVNGFCHLARKIIKRGVHGYVLCSELQVFSWWRRPKSLMDEKEVSNDGKTEEVEGKEEEMFEIEQIPLYYTWPSRYYCCEVHENISINCP